MTAPGPRPYVLLAELSYDCPLHCPYCSNPPRSPRGEELTATEWSSVFAQARRLGVLHVGLSGGEPLRRSDLEEIVAAARSTELYSNLITSAVGLQPDRIRRLRDAGLDSVQISFQAHEPALADEIAGARAHRLKLEAAGEVRAQGLPLTVNVVLHRANIDFLEEIIELAERLECIRLELANVQFYGWAWENKRQLLPTLTQVLKAQEVALEAKSRLRGRMDILYVLPDYHQKRPKPCMQGWGQRYLTVNPIGQVLPCPTAFTIPDLVLENVRQKPLHEIWHSSDSFNRFRGTDWMPEPCRSCLQKEIDFGGCRCQAAQILGDASATDPVCELSPDHSSVTSLLELETTPSPWKPRTNPGN